MRVLFVTRVHPPIVGGLENQSYDLIRHLRAIHDQTFVIANRRGKKALPFFLPYALIKALLMIRAKRITHVHLSDGLLAPLGWLIKKLTKAKVIITVQGLDLTYTRRLYQAIVPPSLRRLDRVICASRHTLQISLSKGADPARCVIVANGVDCDQYILPQPRESLRARLSELLGQDLAGRKVLLTVGRLVPRKGVRWFVGNVLPRLDSHWMYLVAGEGKERQAIQQAIAAAGVGDRVRLLGLVSPEMLRLLYNSADLMIMPNIFVPGDAEGFGIVVIEAGSCGLPVIASSIEGLRDAVIDGKTGHLVEQRDAQAFAKQIAATALNRQDVIKAVRENFAWPLIARRYREEFAKA